MEIIKQEKNGLLNREEIIFSVEEASTPSKESAMKMVMEKTKKTEDSIIIDKIDSQFGSKSFVIHAKVYGNKESRESYEILTRKQKKATKKAEEESAKKAAEEKVAAENAKAEETKVEENSE